MAPHLGEHLLDLLVLDVGQDLHMRTASPFVYFEMFRAHPLRVKCLLPLTAL